MAEIENDIAPRLTPTAKPSHRQFVAQESERISELNGTILATFWQRLLGFAVDLFAAVLVWAPLEVGWRLFVLHEQEVHVIWDFHEVGNVIVVLLYYGLCNYLGNGQTPGKWVARTRAVSLTHSRMKFWQSIERALGYGAAVLEGGLGFLQYFWSENHMCAQDRLAETIVIDVRQPKH